MQCPTCGSHTPGTLGRCSNCDAPQGVPLGAPLAEAAPPLSISDQTVMVPPPSPSWAAGSSASGAAEPGGAQPGNGPQAEEPRAESQRVDPESTSAWAFEPDRSSGGFAAAPPPPPTWVEQPGTGSPDSSAAETSIVPESWYAKPRNPDGAPVDPGPERWSPQQPAAQEWNTPLAPPTQMDWNVSPEVGQQQQWGQQPEDPHGKTAVMGSGAPGDATPMAPPPSMPPPGMPPMGQGPQGFGPPPQNSPMGQFGMAPGQPPYPPPPGPPSAGGPNKALLIGVAALVAVAVAVVGLVIWPDGDKTPPKAKPPATSSPGKNVGNQQPIGGPTRQQAAQLNAVLNASAATRRELVGALTAARKCEGIPQAITGFKRVAERRQNQLRRTQALKLDKLANAERLRLSLRQAFQASLDVDQGLLTWAQRNQQGCRGKPRPDAAKVPGRAVGERRATLAKRQFVRLWNPVAKKTGQPQRQWNGL